jgi:hypothetical protein
MELPAAMWASVAIAAAVNATEMQISIDPSKASRLMNRMAVPPFSAPALSQPQARPRDLRHLFMDY